MAKYIYISKLEAVRKQLETAIKLFFQHGDIVSIHTLAAASHQILMDLGKRQGVRSLIKDQLFEKIKPKYQKEIFKKINEAENFFKHADIDEENNYKFSYESTDHLIWDACRMYTELLPERPNSMMIFNA